uniref:Uncharacterized protein n=1 Tax=Globisporangium ultimum (strain ATCC 200006 / CBS 805.95 / DAOM BR144) TaxID=431595 RepID=K3WN98_GLOUD
MSCSFEVIGFQEGGIVVHFVKNMRISESARSVRRRCCDCKRWSMLRKSDQRRCFRITEASKDKIEL